MLKLATLLIALSVSSIAWADDCPPSRTHLYRNNPLLLQVFFDNKPAVATRLQLYAGEKLVRSAITDRNGSISFGLLSPGDYRIVIRHKGALDVVVDPLSNGLNGPTTGWSLYPKSEIKSVAGKQVPGKPCPIVMLKED